MFPCLRVPDSDSVVVRARGKESSIRGPSHAIDILTMCCESLLKLPCPRIPKSDGAIKGTRGKHSSIWRPSYTNDRVGVPY